MRMHQHGDSLIHFPLAATWIVAGLWDGYETGATLLHPMLTYLGIACAVLQFYILVRKLLRH